MKLQRQFTKDPLLIRVWDSFWLGFGFLTGVALAGLVALSVLTFLMDLGWVL